jgi:hypothetical protein
MHYLPQHNASLMHVTACFSEIFYTQIIDWVEYRIFNVFFTRDIPVLYQITRIYVCNVSHSGSKPESKLVACKTKILCCV